jgi:RNA polymerase sigma-70 factor (ECF subfamily)
LRTESLKTTETNGEDHSIFMELAEEERKYYLDLALTYLTPVERGIISLYYFEENSMEEVAQITGQSLSNTKVIVHRTRKKLNEILNLLLKNKANILLEI